MKIKISFFLFCLLFVFKIGRSAGFENDAVFRIVNNYNHVAMAIATGSNDLMGVTSAQNDRKQWWYAVSSPDAPGAFYLRNVMSGAYMSVVSPSSDGWGVYNVETPDPTKMLIEAYHSTFRPSASPYSDDLMVLHLYGNKDAGKYAHRNASSNVISYTWQADASQWLIEKVELSDQELALIKERMNNVGSEISKVDEYARNLENLFKDYACTDLLDNIILEGNPDYENLSPTLRKMVDKVAAEKWDEKCGQFDWDSPHAFKYRVQYYEPYSEGSAAAGFAGIQAYTNMNNPTGIVSKTDEVLYVMVDSDIPSGATLYINGAPDEGMYNSVNAGQKLHKGLNAIMTYDDHTHFYIYYTVATVSGGKPVYKVTEFPPIKIHIEGGNLNGFFNYIGDSLYTADTWDDFKYTSSRATHVMYDLVGKYVILHFHLFDMPSKVGGSDSNFGVRNTLNPDKNPGQYRYNPVEIMTEWDNMCLTQRILMGIQSKKDIELEFNRGMYSDIVGEQYTAPGYTAPQFYYSDYFNNRMMGISMQGDLYMNATSWRTAFNVNTITYVLNNFQGDGLWGPAHEYGHMNQGPINIAGTTEVSNNIFSNVATYFSKEYKESRADYPSDQLAAFCENKNYIFYGVFNTTRMFWQLWCYYHGTKHNTGFYPRLYELLRKNPIRKSAKPNVHYQRYDLLHFAKMCCIAAGEDLTEFFNTWGFFVPQDHVLIDDYSQFDAVLTPEDIAAVKEEIKEFGFPENKSIIFIDDRVGKNSRVGEFGSFDDFANGGRAPENDLGFTVDGTTVKIGNSEGCSSGFLIYDEDGNLLAFSNSSTFDVSPDIAQALLDGKASIEAVGSDNSTAEVTNTILDGSIDDKINILRQLIESVDALLENVDPTKSKVGYIDDDKAWDLRYLRDEAEENLNSTDGDLLSEIIKELSAEYLALSSDPDARIGIEPGATYHIHNSYYNTRHLAANDTRLIPALYDEKKRNSFENQWVVTPVGTEGRYTIRNLHSGKYIDFNSSEFIMSDNPAEFSLMEVPGVFGKYAILTPETSRNAIHISGGTSVIKWVSDAEASRWTLTKLFEKDYVTIHDQLMPLIDDARSLLAEAGRVEESVHENVPLTSDCFYSNAPYTGNNESDRFKSWEVLLDGNASTYFHSDWSGNDSADGLHHYIQIKAPGDDTFRYITFSYTSLADNRQSSRISAFNIESSIDGSAWNIAYTSTGNLVVGSAKKNTTPEIRLRKGTKYIRFIVTGSPEMAHSHYIFSVSEVAVTNRTDAVTGIPDSKYPNVLPSHIENVATTLSDIDEDHSYLAVSYDDLSRQYDTLSNSYNALYNAMYVVTGISSVGVDAAPVEYFNLQGMRVENPASGIYIRRQGSHVEKVRIP